MVHPGVDLGSYPADLARLVAASRPRSPPTLAPPRSRRCDRASAGVGHEHPRTLAAWGEVKLEQWSEATKPGRRTNEARMQPGVDDNQR